MSTLQEIKYILSIFISILPANVLRVFAYRVFFNYKIISSKIGFGTIISVESVELNNCKIGTFNSFRGPMKIIMKNKSRIGSHNNFVCGAWTEHKPGNYKRTLELNENSGIARYHSFDIAGLVSLGKNTRIAGAGSQFWTHGIGVVDRDIIIGSDCYLGSAVRLAPGSGLGNNTILGMGSVLTKKIHENNAMIAGVPAKIIKNNYNWKRHIDKEGEN